jgi:uncharacterized delta-60 repeat protein
MSKSITLAERLVLAFLAVLFTGGFAMVRGQSALDGFDPNANNVILVAVVQADGKILVGGSFSSLSPNGGAAVPRNFMARLNSNGTVDATFNPNPNSTVNTIALQADGKILIGGFFNSLSPNGGVAIMRNRIARLNPDGTVDPTFDPNASASVRALTVQPDGKILVGGLFGNIGGANRNRIARLDPTNGAADSFDPNANNTVFAIAVQADGKILAGGNFSGANSIGGQTRNRIARLDPTTGLADSFDPNANGGLVAIAIQPDGRILVGGSFNGTNSIGGQARNRIARLDPVTGLADGFNPNANFQVSAITLQPDGKILVGGDFNGVNAIGGAARNNIARLDPNTGVADSFDPKASNQASVFAIALQGDGKVVAAGNFTTIAANGATAVPRNNIVRLETDGRLDRTLDLAIVGTQVRTIAVQPDGKILIAGRFSSVLGVSRNKMARLNSDGTLDMAFNPNVVTGLFGVVAMALQADGKIIVGGDFNGFGTTIGGQSRDYIARLDPVTGAADSWNPRANADVSAILIQPDGKILVGGDFSGFNSIGGASRNGMARLDPTTGQADAFNPNANHIVIAMARQTDGKILVSGRFSEIGGQPRNLMARIDGTTGLVDSFDPSPTGLVLEIAVQGDGKIVVVGDLNMIGGASRLGVARLDPITGLADGYDPHVSGQCNALAVQSDGKILVGGGFNTVGTVTRHNVARLDPVTGAPDSWNPDAASGVLALAIQADGKILVGGDFNGIGGQARNVFARLSNDTAALSDLVVAQNGVTWMRGGSSAQFSRVHLESSTDNVSYNALGEGTRSGSNWELSGLNLPIGANIYIRARGYYGTGNDVGSESVQEVVRQAFFTQAAPVPTPTPMPTPTPTPVTTLANISTRLRVETGDNVLIGGFIVTGTQPKKIIVRAIGTSLPLADKLADPTLELHGPTGLIEANDNWIDSPNKQAIIDSTIAPTSDLESAIVQTLPANGTNYTAIVRGVNGGTGIGVVEAYDLDTAADSRLANISTRGFVQTGDNVLIAGTIVVGPNSQKVLIRGIGPSLTIPGRMENPNLELRDSSGALLQTNDNWVDSPDKQAIIDTTIPPANDLESAIVATLPGNGASYTAILRGVSDTTGIAVVEVYALP